MTALMERLQTMGTSMEYSLAIGILVATIEVTQLLPVTSAIKTLAENNTSWKYVTSRSIKDTNSIQFDNNNRDRSHASSTVCQIFSKSNHRTGICSLNPSNPNK